MIRIIEGWMVFDPKGFPCTGVSHRPYEVKNEAMRKFAPTTWEKLRSENYACEKVSIVKDSR